MSKSIVGSIGRSDGEFDPSAIKVTEKKVALKILDKGIERTEGGIIIPEKAEINSRLGHYEVIDVSTFANKEYGIDKGDYVYADRLSVFYDTSPVCIMNYENIICKSDKDGKELSPLKNMIFVEEERKDDVYKENNIFIASTTYHLPIGVITKMDLDETWTNALQLEIGDKIVLTTGADICTIKGQKFRIYKPDMLIAKVESE